MSFFGEMAVAVAGTLVAGLIATEVVARAPLWIAKLHARALARLPERDRERCGEEWAADLLDQPTMFSRLVFAAGLLWAAEKIRYRHLVTVRAAAGKADGNVSMQLKDEGAWHWLAKGWRGAIEGIRYWLMAAKLFVMYLTPISAAMGRGPRAAALAALYRLAGIALLALLGVATCITGLEIFERLL